MHALRCCLFSPAELIQINAESDNSIGQHEIPRQARAISMQLAALMFYSDAVKLSTTFI